MSSMTTRLPRHQALMTIPWQKTSRSTSAATTAAAGSSTALPPTTAQAVRDKYSTATIYSTNGFRLEGSQPVFNYEGEDQSSKSFFFFFNSYSLLLLFLWRGTVPSENLLCFLPSFLPFSLPSDHPTDHLNLFLLQGSALQPCARSKTPKASPDHP